MFDELEKVVFPRFFYSNSGKKYLSLMSELGPPTTRLGTTSTAPLFQQTSNASLLNGGSKNAAHPRPRAFSDSDDERITSIEVTNFEKRFDKEKFYVYEIKVTREIREGGSAQKYPDDLFIYRRYSEFLQLHHEVKIFFFLFCCVIIFILFVLADAQVPRQHLPASATKDLHWSQPAQECGQESSAKPRLLHQRHSAIERQRWQARATAHLPPGK